MSRLVRLLNIASWSIRQKLIVAFALTLIVPLVIVLLVLDAGANIRDQATTETYVELTANERLTQIDAALREAFSILNEITTNLRYVNDIRAMFIAHPLRSERRQQATDLLQDRLVRSRLFTNVTVLDHEGKVVANAPRTSNIQVRQDWSNRKIYQVALDASTLRADQRSSLYLNEAGSLKYDIVQVIYYADQTLAGYLIATLDIDRLISLEMPVRTEFIPLFSYLTTDDGLVLTNPAVRTLATQHRQHTVIDNALTSKRYTSAITYQIGDDQFTTFISPLRDTRLYLVTTTSTEVILTSPFDQFVQGNGLLVLMVIILFVAVIVLALDWLITAPLVSIRDVLADMTKGDFSSRLEAAERSDEIGLTAQAVVNVRSQVSSTISQLETRVAEGVRDIQATQEVARAAATQRDLQALMNTVVNLIIRAFPNIYHAQIFLIDADDKYAVLRASTGEAGIKLLERGHRLGVGSVSVIGAVTSEGRTIIARDTAASTIHKRNEFLPDTRAELAIPLRVGDRIIGALDVQSRQDNSFSEDQVKLLETMADQIAISLDNARLYEESIRRLEQITQASREGTLKAWQDHMAGQRSKSVVVHAGIRTTTETTALRQAAIDQGMTIVGTQTERNTIPFAVPIELRGQVLGAVEWELPVNDYSYEKVLLAEELVSRLAISLDNARLFEQSQRAAERERIVNTIAAKITGHTNIDEILRTAIQEVGQALRVPEVNIRLGGITHEQ